MTEVAQSKREAVNIGDFIRKAAIGKNATEGASKRSPRLSPLPLRFHIGAELWLQQFGNVVEKQSGKTCECALIDHAKLPEVCRVLESGPYWVIKCRTACESLSLVIPDEGAREVIQLSGRNCAPSLNAEANAEHDTWSQEIILRLLSLRSCFSRHPVYLKKIEHFSGQEPIPYLVTAQRKFLAQAVDAFPVRARIGFTSFYILAVSSPRLTKHWREISAHLAHSGNLGAKSLSHWTVSIGQEVEALLSFGSFNPGQRIALENHNLAAMLSQVHSSKLNSKLQLALRCDGLHREEDTLVFRFTVMES